MKERKSIVLNKGFTLIEVAVALAILGWVLGSAISLVKQYADERLRMRESFLSSQVAWNQLLGEYRYSRGWQPNNPSSDLNMKGTQWQGGNEWFWEISSKPALGDNLYRYQVEVGQGTDTRSTAMLSIYLLSNGADQ